MMAVQHINWEAGQHNVIQLAVLTQFLISKVAVGCVSLPRSHSSVVCGGWHLALRLSCPPPPLFSALQWDHVVLLISQQWPYSLPFPLFSPSLSTFPHSLSSSSPPSPAQTIFNFLPTVTSTLFTLLGPSQTYLYLLFNPVLLYQPPTHRALWSLGCRWPALQVSPEHQSTLWQPQLLLETRVHIRENWEVSDQWFRGQRLRVWLTCQGFLIVFPHGHKVLQTGVELVQNPLLTMIQPNNKDSPIMTNIFLELFHISNQCSTVDQVQRDQ